jgi:hypothetical protein
MPPHGPGMLGAVHSHDPEYPDDTWNLYSMLDVDQTTALNVTRPQDTLGIMKPFVHRLSENPCLVSDADAEVIVLLTFVSPVSVRKIMVIGGGEGPDHPAQMRCYVNQVALDFTGIEALRPVQQFDLPINLPGTVELFTSLQPFTNITSLALYFPFNHGGGETTRIRYIGLQGEHTHHRREAVDAVYEVLCNGQDIAQPEEGPKSLADLGKPHLH